MFTLSYLLLAVGAKYPLYRCRSVLQTYLVLLSMCTTRFYVVFNNLIHSFIHVVYCCAGRLWFSCGERVLMPFTSTTVTTFLDLPATQCLHFPSLVSTCEAHCLLCADVAAPVTITVTFGKSHVARCCVTLFPSHIVHVSQHSITHASTVTACS